MTRLSEMQLNGLEVLADQVGLAARLETKVPWIGAKEGVSGTTLEALERKGLAEVRWATKPYRRLVGRINEAGAAELRARRERERIRLEGRQVEAQERSDFDVGLGEIEGGEA